MNEKYHRGPLAIVLNELDEEYYRRRLEAAQWEADVEIAAQLRAERAAQLEAERVAQLEAERPRG